jgi:hypothetical protein
VPDVEPMTAERIGRNDATFRDANEQIRAKAIALHKPNDQSIFSFASARMKGCTSLISISLDAYEEVRSDSRQFMNILGHERVEV